MKPKNDILVRAIKDALAAFDNDTHRGNNFFNGENSAIRRMRSSIGLDNEYVEGCEDCEKAITKTKNKNERGS